MHLVSCSTQHLSQGEELGLGVVSASVVAAWVVIQARGHCSSWNRHCWLLAGWCMLSCGRVPCFLSERGAGMGFSIKRTLSESLSVALQH